MRTKLFFVFFMTILLTVFSGAAFGGVSGKISCPQDLVKLQFKTLSKSAAKTVALLGTGKVSGRVIDRNGGAPIVGITVTAWPLTGDFCVVSGGNATTDENGEYTIIELASGPYNVEFSDDTEKLYSRQWYNDKLDEAQASVIQVTEPATTTGINASLDKGGSISGKVTCPSGASSSTFIIQAVGSNGYTADASAMLMSIPGIPGFDGSYTLSGLPSDTYTVSFSNIYATDQEGNPANRCVPQDLTQVTVTAPSSTANINMTLALGSSIIGKLVDSSSTPIQGVMVYATAPNSPTQFFGGTNFGLSGPDGNFTISGLAAGTYDVIINGRMSGTGYILLKLPSQTVTLPGPKDIGTQTLQPGGMIKGTVKNKSGVPLENVSVIGYDATTGEFISYTTTVANGTYTLTGFATGSYKVQFVACQGSYAEQWYDGKTTQASATPVAVTAPNVILGKDGVLDLAGTGDTTPPVTTASPLGGTFSTPQTVSLTSNEAATIYYTTNGTEPTTASSVYTGPLTINVSTTLKYFAKDTAGNPETVKSQEYVITATIYGECGSSAYQTFATAPTTNLCNVTTTTPTVQYMPNGNYQWVWDCTGNTGVIAACMAFTPGNAPIQGDCDGDKLVSIAEVQSAINMFLGINDVRGCVDWNAVGGVTIDEVQKTINGFLGL